MPRDFYAVAIPEPTTILGVRLRPFSLGHLILLHRVRSAFVTPDETLTIHDLALSVLFCSMTYMEGCELFNRTDLPKQFTAWHRKLSGGWLARLGLRKETPIDYAKKSLEFSEYLNRGSASPNYTYNPSEFRSMDCPSVQVIKVSMMKDLHIPEAELMDRPWAMCVWDHVTLRAMAGQITLIDDDVIKKAQESAEKLAAALRAKGFNVAS